MKKRSLLLVLFIVVAFSAFAASQSEGSAVSDLADADLVNPRGTLPIAKEKVTVSVFSHWNSRKMENPMTQWVADQLNIEVEWAIQTRDGLDDKFNVKMAADDLDDITQFYGLAGSLTGGLEAVEDDYFYPISDLFDEYGDAIPQWMAAESEMWEITRASDGKFYSVPGRPIAFDDQFKTRILIEQTWLDRLGLDMPTTTEEYFDVLVAFRDNDANGNGDPNDEYPLVASTTRPFLDYQSPLFGAFLDNFGWLHIKNGQVYNVATTDAFRDALRYMNRLWEEGLVHPASMSQHRNDVRAMNDENSYTVVGSTLGQHEGYVGAPGGDTWKTYNYLPPLEGPGGINITWRAPKNLATLGTGIGAKTEIPATAFRFLDWLSSEEGHLVKYYGIEGTHYRKSKPGELNVAGEQATWTEIVENRDINWGWGHLGVIWGGTGLFHDTLMAVVKTPDTVNVSGMTPDEMIYKTSVEYLEHVDSLDTIWPANIIYSPAVRTEQAILSGNVNGLIYEVGSQFVAGDLDLDADWDKFQADLKAAGIERYLEICQEAWNARNK
jgi:putative aldouronate transport system substrate-binding protein